MNENTAMNPYAPPQVIEENGGTDTYLEHEGYSESCMLLCNSYFNSPRVCVRTGVDLAPENTVPMMVTLFRKQPSLFSSPLRLGTWVIRLCLLGFLFFNISSSEGGDLATLFLIIGGIITVGIHRVLSRATSLHTSVQLYISKTHRSSRRLKQVMLGVLVVASIFLFLWMFGSPLCLIYLVLALYLTILLKGSFGLLIKVRSNGEYVYFKGAHPHYLAQLPLRGAPGESTPWGVMKL